MTTCPHLVEGCCMLAEGLAKDLLHLSLECPTTEDRCKRCGGCDDGQVTVVVLGNVKRACPAEHQTEWARLATAIHRGLPPTPAPSRVTRAPELPCIHRGDVVGRFPCACFDGSVQSIFTCGLGGKCVLKEKHVERAVEQLRTEFQDEPLERKVRSCAECGERSVAQPFLDGTGPAEV